MAGKNGGARPGAGRPRKPIDPFEDIAMSRTDLWHYIRERKLAGAKRYNPFFVAVDLMEEVTDMRIVVHCVEILADRLLPKMKAVEHSGMIDHHHTSAPIQVLFTALEQEEVAQRESLPDWRPPALDLGQGPDGVWQDTGGDEERER